jgi:glycosyltransferase involved in cell wall biosynthesis
VTRRLRVMRIIARMNVGGPSLQVTALTRYLDPSLFETRLLVGAVGAEEGDYRALRAPDVPAVHVEGLGRAPDLLDDVRALRRVRAEIRAFRPDIVHTHTAKAGALGRVVARASRVPMLVHTFHGHLLHGYFSPAVTRAVVMTERALARTTNRLMAVGERVRDELLAAGIGRTDQYTVVPPGIELPTSPPKAEARARLDLPVDAAVVGFVGRLTRVKRPDRLVEVLKALMARDSTVHAVVAGGGELLTQVAADLGGSPRVRLLGWWPDVEVVYGAADLVLLTSDNEGMPVSLIEAAACGCPVVATDVGSVREVVADGETGLVVPRSAADIATAARALLDDPSRRAAMARAGRARASDRFSRARLVRDVETAYLDLAAAAGLIAAAQPRGSA